MNYEKIMSFQEFKNHLNKNQLNSNEVNTNKTKEEIIDEAENILKQFSRGGE